MEEFAELNFHIETSGGGTGSNSGGPEIVEHHSIDQNTNSKDDMAHLDADADLDADSHHLGDIDDPNDTSLKDIDDTLDLGSLGANASSLGDGMSPSFNMNGNNVSTHTFRKTEWDVKKLENYVRMSFGDATPMENMQPALMNRYLKA